MPLTINYHRIPEKKFDYPFRCFISGSSQSGKTHFSHRLLYNSNIFTTEVKQVVYYHPDYLDHIPVSWHETLGIPVSYQSGVPTLQDICALKSHTCIVLDDLFEECIQSAAIDYLFRVLSGKNNLCVLILSQRYFANGRYGLNIRNNCNYTVMMRNVDCKLNCRIASSLSLRKPIEKAIEYTYEDNFWPYIFVDSTPKGQVSGYRCYIDIYSSVQVAVNQKGMKGYIISETDFLRHFEIIDNNTARQDGEYSKISIQSGEPEKKLGEKTSTETSRNITERIGERARRLRKSRRLRKNL